MNSRQFYFDEVNIHSIIVSLFKNLWVIVILCLSVVLCVFSASRLFYEPVYTSTATFMVGARDSTNAYNSLTTTQSMASVFAEVFQSNVLREKIEEKMDEEFTGVINTTTIPKTNLVVVKVTSPSPEMSFSGLTLIVENYNTISDYLFSNAQLEVIKDPTVPIIPSNSLELKNIYLSTVLITAGVGILLIIFLCAIRDTVQTPKAVRRKIDARLLRTIQHESKNKTIRSKLKKKNQAPLITLPLISKGFIEDNMCLCSAVDYHMRKHSQKVIMVTSAGENEGKSTVTANLAIALAEKNKKVLLLDCDFRKPSLHKILENPVSKENSFSEYLINNSEDFTPYICDVKKYGIKVGISHANNKNISSIINNGKFSDLISRMRNEMDYIILDTPPMLAAADSEAIARLTDTAIMVVRTDFMHTVAINDCLDNLRKCTPDIAGIVLNNHYNRISLFE